MSEKPTEEALGDQYKAAWDEWYASGDAELWETVVGDSLEDEPERRGAPRPAPSACRM